MVELPIYIAYVHDGCIEIQPSTDVWKSIVDERSIAQAMETKLPFFLVTIFAIVSCNKFSKLSFFFLKIL
jgi:hypothetical protein